MTKGKCFYCCFWENKFGNWTGNTNKVGNNISIQNKLDMLFQPSRVIERPNHSMMEYSLLSWCNHKARLDSPKACHLAWHPWLDMIGQECIDSLWWINWTINQDFASHLCNCATFYGPQNNPYICLGLWKKKSLNTYSRIRWKSAL